MAQQVHQAAIVGFGTTKIAGAGALTDRTLLAALTAVDPTITAFPDSCKGCDIVVVTGPVYIENDGTAANADCVPVESGQTYPIRNARELMTKLHLFAPGAHDIRVALNG